jgi:hypothetical protein
LGLQGKNAIMLIPVNLPPAGPPESPVPAYGLFGIQELIKMAKQIEDKK